MIIPTSRPAASVPELGNAVFMTDEAAQKRDREEWDNEGGAERPASTTTSASPIMVHLEPEPLQALDAWIKLQPEPRPTRPEAVRRVLWQGLQTASASQLQQDRMDAWDADVGRLDKAEKERKAR